MAARTRARVAQGVAAAIQRAEDNHTAADDQVVQRADVWRHDPESDHASVRERGDQGDGRGAPHQDTAARS
eukprot:scaffold82382_cov72-Phaeocystis_antarctica.AAC.9